VTPSAPNVGTKPEIVIVGPMYPPTQQRLETLFVAHRLWTAADRQAFLGELRDRVRGIAVYALHSCPAALIEALRRLEIIACFGIGVDSGMLGGVSTFTRTSLLCPTNWLKWRTSS
jgi:lactate dehydrogenase-like 2-hydroxyacid dehydrogenase